MLFMAPIMLPVHQRCNTVVTTRGSVGYYPHLYGMLRNQLARDEQHLRSQPGIIPK